MTGWRKERPGLSRASHAFPVIAGLAVLAALIHSVLMGKYVLCGFGSYGRPSETLALRGVDFIPPLGGVRFWCMLIRAQELAIPTKTGEYDDSVVWDVEALMFMTRDFAEWRKRGDAKVFPFSYSEVLKTVQTCAAHMGVEGLTPYAMRHAGASHDAIHKLRPLGEIQKRGRWRCHRSVTRYEKGGRVGASFARINAETRQWMERCARNLEQWVNRPHEAPRLRDARII